MQNNQFLRVKSSLLELEKDPMGLKNTGLRNKKGKIKKEIEKLFNKLNMDKLWISLKTTK